MVLSLYICLSQKVKSDILDRSSGKPFVSQRQSSENVTFSYAELLVVEKLTVRL